MPPRQRPDVSERFRELLKEYIRRYIGQFRSRGERMTQEQIAQQLNYSRWALQNWLNGNNAISRDDLLRLVSLIGLTRAECEELLAEGKYASLTAQELQAMFGTAAEKEHSASDSSTPESEPPPAPSPASMLHQLRAPSHDFVGRADELGQIVATLRGAASGGAVAGISGVRGMGGIGKTELAYVVAEQVRDLFADAQLVIELLGSQGGAALTPVQALQNVIHAFNREAQLPDDERELVALYRSTLAGKRVLILADDARDAAQVRPLIPPTGSALLITSRQRFQLPGMLKVDLERLSNVQAVDLLCKTCSRLTPEQAGQIAKLCGNLPLALIISGGILDNDDQLDIGHYIQQLRDERRRLEQLRDPDDPNLDVEVSLNLSYAALDATAQQALAQLAVFAGSFDRAAVAATLSLPEGAELDDVLGLLRRRSLLEFDQSGQRYSLHELVRVFALAQLKTDEERAARLRHARHYIQVAEQAEQQFLAGNAGIASGLALFDAERIQLDAARAWLQQHPGTPDVDELLIADAGATAYIGHLRYPKRGERISQMETALTAARRTHNRAAQSVFLGNLGLAYADLDEVRKAIELYQQTLVMAREIGDRRSEGAALGSLGTAYKNLGEIHRAIDFYQQGLVIAREIGDRRSEEAALINLGVAYKNLGEIHRAIDFYQQGLIIAREIGDRQGEGNALGNLGVASMNLGETHRAIDFYQQQLEVMREIGDRRGEGIVLGNIGVVYKHLGETHQAIDFYEQRLVIAREIGDRRGESYALGNLGIIYADMGEARTAIEFYQQTLTVLCEIGDRRGEGTILGSLGNAYATLGELQQATEFYQQALVIAREIGDRQGEARANWNYGLALVEQNKAVQALPLLEAGLGFNQEIGHPRAVYMATTLDHVRQHGTLPAPDQPSDALEGLPDAVRQAIEQRDGQALRAALAALPDEEAAAIVERLERAGIIERQQKPTRDPSNPEAPQQAVEEGPRTPEELFAALPERVRRALERGDEVAFQAALAALPAEERRAVELAIAQAMRAAQPDPRERFAALLREIAGVALGNAARRQQVEAQLDQLEQDGWMLREPVRRIWAGERDAAALAAGLDEQDTALVERVLELISALHSSSDEL